MANAVADVIPGGSHHDELRRRFDLFVGFLGELKDNDGKPIPIIFRPWHENNQRRFWWSVRGDGQDYIKLWRFTVEYLRDKKGVHNLLYAYTPLALKSEKDTFTKPESGYPGDAYVDVIGIDNYSGKGKSTAASARLAVEIYEVEGVPIRVVSREGLLKMKRIAGRPQDLSDIDNLERGGDET